MQGHTGTHQGGSGSAGTGTRIPIHCGSHGKRQVREGEKVYNWLVCIISPALSTGVVPSCLVPGPAGSRVASALECESLMEEVVHPGLWMGC